MGPPDVEVEGPAEKGLFRYGEVGEEANCV